MSNYHSRRRLGRPRPRRRNRTLIALTVVGVLGLLGCIGGGVVIAVIADSTPPLSSMTSRDPGATSEVLAANGERLGFIQSDALRVPVSGSEIPKSLKDAIVSIEDERFYHHNGVDYLGVARAAARNAMSNKTKEGGSTITMQLVRNLYISNERTYERKIREAKLAIELERKHTKAWILDNYLNSVPFGTVGGQTAVGAEAAARMYFSKPAKQLTVGESALLAGLPQAPTTYSPIRAADKAKTRRNEVLTKMAQRGVISQERAKKAMREPLKLKPSRYFTKKRESYFFDYVKDELIKEYGEKRVRQGGLKIHTTIDLGKQHAARNAIAGRLAGVGPSAGIVTINPRNGHILAMTTSSDYGQSQFNLAAQGHRQPGSAFKVMALMAALEQGANPESTYYTSRQFSWPKAWGGNPVTNYGKSYGGSMNLATATVKSDNTIFAQLALDVGPQAVKETAKKMGITSKLKGYPAETLGGLDIGVTPLEMANAYATIASGGYRNRPTAIKKVVHPDGHSETPKRFRVKRKKVFDDGLTNEATKILVRNIQGGTGTGAGIGCPAGGKTGTTDDFNDAWFAGFTPKLATAVWVGYPNAQIQMNTEFHGGPVNGGSFPAQIWGDYMRVAKGGFCGDFPAPTTPFVSKSFKGKHSSGSKKEDEDSSSFSSDNSGSSSKSTDSSSADTKTETAAKADSEQTSTKTQDKTDAPQTAPTKTAEPSETGGTSVTQ